MTREVLQLDEDPYEETGVMSQDGFMLLYMIL